MHVGCYVLGGWEGRVAGSICCYCWVGGGVSHCFGWVVVNNFVWGVTRVKRKSEFDATEIMPILCTGELHTCSHMTPPHYVRHRLCRHLAPLRFGDPIWQPLQSSPPGVLIRHVLCCPPLRPRNADRAECVYVYSHFSPLHFGALMHLSFRRFGVPDTAALCSLCNALESPKHSGYVTASLLQARYLGQPHHALSPCCRLPAHHYHPRH